MADISVLTSNVIEREQAKVDQAVAAYEQELTTKTETEKESLKQKFVARKFELEKENKRKLDISLNSVSLKKRDQILDVKQTIIRDYIAEVKHAFEQLDAPTTQQFIQGVLSEYENQEKFEIVLGEKTHEILKDSLQVNVPVSSEIIPGKAGFVLRQASIEYNYLFDNLIEEKTSSLQKLVVNSIFKTS